MHRQAEYIAAVTPNPSIHRPARKAVQAGDLNVGHEEHMTRILPFALVLFISLLMSITAQAQSLYDEETSQLAGTLRSLMVRAERIQQKDESGRYAIQEELFELSKKLHRLEEEASSANVELLKRGNPPDRQLLLTASICKALDLAQEMTANYLDTRDKIFWSTAVQAAQSARSMKEIGSD